MEKEHQNFVRDLTDGGFTVEEAELEWDKALVVLNMFIDTDGGGE